MTPDPSNGADRPRKQRTGSVRFLYGSGSAGFMALFIWLQNTPDLLPGLPRTLLMTLSVIGALGQALAAAVSPVMVREWLRGRRSRRLDAEALRKELPVPVERFVGYAEERARLSALFAGFPTNGWRRLLRPFVRRHQRGPDGPRLAVVITGLPATGKSQLAIRVAHDVAERFPDGVRWVDLSHNSREEEGTDPDAGAADRNDAGAAPGKRRWWPLLRRFSASDDEQVGMEGPRLGPIVPRPVPDVLGELLDGMGGDTPRGPRRQLEDTWQRATAGKRLLLVLENAEDPRQIEPLLPRSGLSAVLVTSRRSFEDAAFDYEPVQLQGLSHNEGSELLNALAPLDTGTTPTARAEELRLRTEIVRKCHGLPLALSMCGRRLAVPAGPDTAQLLRMLDREEESPLLHAPSGFPTSFTSVFQMCGPAARLLLRRMAATGIDEASDAVAAALLDVPLAEAHKVLEELRSLFLIELLGESHDKVSRYHMHELVRETLRVLRPEDVALPPQEERAWEPAATASALERVLLAYTWLAEDAMRVMRRGGGGFPQPRLARARGVDRLAERLGLEGHEERNQRDIRPGTGESPESGQRGRHRQRVEPDERIAQSWLEREREMLLGCIWMAAAAGHAPLAWRVARAVAAMCQTARTHWEEWEQAVRAQRVLAYDQRDVHALGMALLDSSELAGNQGQYEAGAEYARKAATVFTELAADPRWSARAARARGVSLQRWGDLEGAWDQFALAERIFAETGEDWWHARTLYNLAELRTDQGEHEAAQLLLERAAEAFREEGDSDQVDLTRILLADVLAARGRDLHAWYLLTEMRRRFGREGRHWHAAQCLRVLGGLDDARLEAQYRQCDLVFNPVRRPELRDAVERDTARELRQRGGRRQVSLEERLETKQRCWERARADAAVLLGEFAEDAEQRFSRRGSTRRGAARERAREWSPRGRIARLGEAIELMERMGDKWGVHRAQFTLGRVLIRNGRPHDGQETMAKASEGFGRLSESAELAGQLSDRRWQARANHVAAWELFVAVLPDAATEPEVTDADTLDGEPPEPRYSAATQAVAAKHQTLARRAYEHARDARDLYEQRDDHANRIRAEILLARIQWATDRSAEEWVWHHLRSAETDAEEHGHSRLAAEAWRWRRAFFELHPKITDRWPISAPDPPRPAASPENRAEPLGQDGPEDPPAAFERSPRITDQWPISAPDPPRQAASPENDPEPVGENGPEDPPAGEPPEPEPQADHADHEDRSARRESTGTSGACE